MNMKWLLDKYFNKSIRKNKSELRKSFRVPHNFCKIKAFVFHDEDNNSYTGKLIDLSENGCRVSFNDSIFLKDKVLSFNFENSTELEMDNKTHIAQVVWSSVFEVQNNNYCIAGMSFTQNI